MGIFSRLFGKKSDASKLEDDHLLDANVCPNCWGREIYDDKYHEYVRDQTKSNIKHEKTHQKAFIQQFVETHVSGIKLKQDGDYFFCPQCNLKHKHVHPKSH